MPNFSDRFIASLDAPGTYWDASLKAFGIRIGKTKKTFIVIRDGGRRIKLGHYPDITLQEARTRAKQISLDPKVLQPSKPLSEAMTVYLETHVRRNYRPMTAYRTQKLLENNTKHLSGRPISQLSSHDFTAIFDKLPPSQANHVYGALKTFFNWCGRRDWGASPLAKLAKPNKDKTRSRVLTDSELKAVWHAAPASRFGTIVKLLILTGQRRGEIAPTVPPKLTETTITFPVTKNGQPHTIPITPSVQRLMDGYEFKPFYSEGKYKAVLDKASGVADWVLHDLRRTFATRCAELGIQPHIIERILNHSSGSMSPIARTYNRHAYQEEMLVAMKTYDDYISRLISDTIDI